MGIDFSCIIDAKPCEKDVLSLPPELVELTTRLDTVFEELQQIWGAGEPPENLLTKSRNWRLSLGPAIAPTVVDPADESVGPLQVELEGPFHFGGIITQQAVTLHHLNRWKWFLANDKGTRGRLMKSCRCFARVLPARRLIYLSDLGIESVLESGSQSFDDMLRHLSESWGPPADWKATYAIDERYWERYFVEELMP